MPIIDHNRISLVQSIKKKAGEVRKLIRRLRHSVERDSVFFPPENVLMKLAKATHELTELMNQYTIRNERDVQKNQNREQFESPINFVNNEYRLHNDYLYTEVDWEREIYRGVGVEGKDYEDLIMWKNALNANEINLVKAYEEFSDNIIDEIHEEKKKNGYKSVILGVAGTVGIAGDLSMFHEYQFTPAIVSSVITGVSAIAREFGFVRKKFYE